MNWGKKDGKTFWKLLDKFEHKQDNKAFKSAISEDRWTSHFKNIFQEPNANDPLPKSTVDQGPLDFEISDEEIQLGSYILRNGKSPGYDSISNEMITCLLNVKPEIIRKLFNALLQNSGKINKWTTSMISPIYKKGNKMMPDNYRAISLTSCFAKFFLSILNTRITKFAIENNILSNGQLGFLPGYKTSDALITLHNLVDYYCRVKNKHIFACFVDFQKAFDCVPRHKLFKKLLEYNINGKFYDCLMNLYSEDNSCIKIDDKITSMFKINRGVKQGCVLSPMLFNIFLSDLQKNIEKNENSPVKLSPHTTLGCLIWADDLLLLSESESGLNNMLKELNKYMFENKMTLNIEKTKAMIFNKTGRHMRRQFSCGEQKVETTRLYKYLGFMITPSGEISTGLHDLKDRALKALMNIKNKLGPVFKKNPLITIKLFDAMVKPILLYASEFWGVLKLPKNNPIETLYISFCKQLLGVQRQTTNNGVLLELGQVPLTIYAKKNAIKNWETVATYKRNKMITKSYENAITHNLKWIMGIKTNLEEMGMYDAYLNKYDNTHIKALQRLIDLFHQNTFSTIKQENSKLRTYSIFKKEIACEEYLSKIQNIEIRTAFTKFRLSNHPLMIEKGRHQQIDKNLRFCPFCPTKIEDEMHFMMNCSLYNSLRRELFTEVNIKIPYFPYMSTVNQFKTLLSNNIIIKHTSVYVYKSLERRKINIDVPSF